LNTFNLDETVKTASDLSNGVCLINVLSQISSTFFNEEWSSKLKTDTSNNWRLKASNLRKILKKLLDFYHQELQFNVPENHQPDVNSIAEKNDEKESSKLIQLLLGCAVNCDNKEEYIQRIMCMEESVQHSIMLSIKELMLSESVNVTDHETHHSHAQVNELMNFDNDSLVHRCNELDQQVLLLSEERAALKVENEKLNQRVNHVDILDDASTPLGRRFQQLQKQADQLQDELFKSEAMKDDYKIKCEILEKDLLLMQNKADSLSRLTEETRNMKDELDILRHTSDKVARYEMTISSLKKKIDDMDELRNQLKMTEDKNVKQQEKIFQLEEELKKSSSHRTQLEVQKRQMIDLQLRVTEECNKSDKLQVDLSRCQERFADLVKEKEVSYGGEDDDEDEIENEEDDDGNGNEDGDKDDDEDEEDNDDDFMYLILRVLAHSNECHHINYHRRRRHHYTSSYGIVIIIYH
ncbi:hypothetical protein HELRODRAFT_62008, partial [Helobdella robusta]|uniref:Calponin-homology (CH) domain-containing protein n=1 Tax=Helobdella robusta TaxID=6412 RepID=T1FWU2_HELRO